MKKISWTALLLTLILAAGPISSVNAQTKRRSVKKNRPVAGATSDQAASAAEVAELKKQLADLAKLSPEQKTKLRSSIDLLQRVIRKVQLTDFPEYFLQSSVFPGEGDQVTKSVDECLSFLPEGLMRDALGSSAEAMVDAWALDLAFKTRIVLDSTLTRIKKYKLEGDSLYLMSRDVLKTAYARSELAARILELIDQP